MKTYYKAFNKDMTCRKKQYAENTVFEEPQAEMCHAGMHFCENPFDVLDYYPLIANDGSLITTAEVEPQAEVKTVENKSVTTKLKIGAKLSFGGFIKAGIDFLLERVKNDAVTADDCYGAQIGSSGYGAQIGSSGYGAQIGSSGDDAKIGSSGYGAKIGSSGSSAQIGSSGYGAQIGSSGDDAKIGSSGYGAKIGSSGSSAQIGSSGYGAQIGSSGSSAQIGSSGNSAQIGSSGYGAQIGSSGNWARIGSSGDGVQIGSSGDWAKIGSSGSSAQIGSSGNHAQIASEGANSVVCCVGDGCAARAKRGSWITLAEWDVVGGEYKPMCVKAEYVDGERIKSDTWYHLEGGEFVEGII